MRGVRHYLPKLGDQYAAEYSLHDDALQMRLCACPVFHRVQTGACCHVMKFWLTKMLTLCKRARGRLPSLVNR